MHVCMSTVFTRQQLLVCINNMMTVNLWSDNDDGNFQMLVKPGDILIFRYCVRRHKG